MKKYECGNCEKEFELLDGVEWGGDAKCPYCGAVHDLSFDTNYGLRCEGLKLEEER